MEKIRCSSCGGDIIIDDDSEYGKCPYCNTKYKLKNDINFNIKLDDNTRDVLNKTKKQFSKFLILPIIIFVAVFVITVFCIFRFIVSSNNVKDNFNKKSFNNQFFYANGTQNAFFLKNTLDNIVESNKTHERKVTLEYENKETINEKEIIEIKYSLDGNYEVSFNYDKNGFINKIIVKKIE